MRRKIVICFVLLLNARGASSQSTITSAVSKYIPKVVWQSRSIVTGDFTCEGHKQTAILGIPGSDVVVAVFLSGLNRKPEELRFNIFQPKFARIQTETLDYELDSSLPGFHRSRSCQGLNVGDDEVDSAHLYWDHESHRFGMWRL